MVPTAWLKNTKKYIKVLKKDAYNFFLHFSDIFKNHPSFVAVDTELLLLETLVQLTEPMSAPVADLATFSTVINANAKPRLAHML